jgi:hypothetical protein
VGLRKPRTIITATITTGIMVAIPSLLTGTIIALTGQGEAMTRSQLVERHLRLGSGLSAPQSSSASRFTAGAFGFLFFTQCGTSPER